MKNRYRQRAFKFLFIVLLAIPMTGVQAEDAIIQPSYSGDKGNSIDEIAMKILLESPGFKTDIYSLKSIDAELKASSNLPDPEVGGEYLVMPEDVDNRWTVELSWALEWPGIYGAKSREAKSKMALADKAVYAQRVEKLYEIKDLLLDYILCSWQD